MLLFCQSDWHLLEMHKLSFDVVAWTHQLLQSMNCPACSKDKVSIKEGRKEGVRLENITLLLFVFSSQLHLFSIDDDDYYF